jgi:diamine N-acetyltransferase
MIKKDDFIIRTIEQNDIEYIHSLNNSDFRGQFQEFQFESKKSLMKQFESDGMCSDNFQMLVVEKDNLIIALIYISFVRTGLANIGLVICENQRAKKLGTKITTTIIDYIFNSYDVKRIQADTDINNVAAQKVLEKAGFVKEGIMKNYRYHHGNYNDSVLYAIIKNN